MKKLIGLLALFMILLSCENNEPELQSDTITFYNWNMKDVNEMIIYNPIKQECIESYTIVIYQDFDKGIKVINFHEFGESIIDGDKIIMTITELSLFNSEDFDNTNQFRGQVIIKYY